MPEQTPPGPIVITTLAFTATWILIVAGILVFGRKEGFRKDMLSKWKPAALVSGVYLLALAIGGRGILNPVALGIFSQAMVGFAALSRVQDAQASNRGKRPIPLHLALLKAIGFALVSAFVAFVVGNIGLGICRSIFHESAQASAAVSSMGADKFQLFWMFLGGSGIAEETLFRLALLSMFWWWTGNRALAIIISSLLFAAYHLTPLSGMYLTFWQYPVSQFVSSLLIGLVCGVVFTRSGYETVVAAHTFSNWIPVVLFMD